MKKHFNFILTIILPIFFTMLIPILSNTFITLLILSFLIIYFFIISILFWNKNKELNSKVKKIKEDKDKIAKSHDDILKGYQYFIYKRKQFLNYDLTRYVNDLKESRRYVDQNLYQNKHQQFRQTLEYISREAEIGISNEKKECEDNEREIISKSYQDN